MTCDFTYGDGAYVLGALAPAERAAFEHHLPGCTTCREAVAALAVLPGLLGRLDARTAAAIDGNGLAIQAPSTLLPRVLAAASLQRRREGHIRRWRVAAAALTAASLIAVVGVGVHSVDVRPHTHLSSMRPITTALPVSGEVGLMQTRSGTQIEMKCRYDEGDHGQWVVRLMVYPRVGSGEQVGTWLAIGGQEVSLNAITHFARADIARLELQTDTGATLLTWVAT